MSRGAAQVAWTCTASIACPENDLRGGARIPVMKKWAKLGAKVENGGTRNATDDSLVALVMERMNCINSLEMAIDREVAHEARVRREVREALQASRKAKNKKT